jgi:predicted N-acetyltransferase YhbS
MNLEIREETDADIHAIEALTIAAFKNAPHTSHTEHFIVKGLRKAGVAEPAPLDLLIMQREMHVATGKQ